MEYEKRIYPIYFDNIEININESFSSDLSILE